MRHVGFPRLSDGHAAMRRWVIYRHGPRNTLRPWFAGERGSRVGERLHIADDSDTLTSWATPAEAYAYIAAFERLRRNPAHMLRTNAEVRERARQIVQHG